MIIHYFVCTSNRSYFYIYFIEKHLATFVQMLQMFSRLSFCYLTHSISVSVSVVCLMHGHVRITNPLWRRVWQRSHPHNLSITGITILTKEEVFVTINSVLITGTSFFFILFSYISIAAVILVICVIWLSMRNALQWYCRSLSLSLKY